MSNWYEAYGIDFEGESVSVSEEVAVSYVIPSYKIERFERESEELRQQLKTKDEKLEKLEKCVEFYADKDLYFADCNGVHFSHQDFNGCCVIDDDEGSRARQTLKEIKDQGE